MKLYQGMAKLNIVVLLFYGLVTTALWPQGQNAALTRPYEFQLGFTHLFLLTTALVSVVFVDRYWSRGPINGRPLLVFGTLMTGLLVTTVPLTALYCWAGLLLWQEAALLYAGALSCSWGFVFYGAVVKNLGGRLSAALAYAAALTVFYWFFGFDWQVLALNVSFVLGSGAVAAAGRYRGGQKNAESSAMDTSSPPGSFS